MRARLPMFVLLAALLAGCAAPPGEPPPEPIWVGPPEVEAGGHVGCATSAAQEMALAGLRSEETDDARGHAPGVHRLDGSTLLWVWADYDETLREDRITRLNPVTVHREPSGEIVVCTRAELVAELFVDDTPRTYAVAAVLTAPHGWPEGPMHAAVNWVVGCTGCAPLRGNSTSHFP